MDGELRRKRAVVSPSVWDADMGQQFFDACIYRSSGGDDNPVVEKHS